VLPTARAAVPDADDDNCNSNFMINGMCSARSYQDVLHISRPPHAPAVNLAMVPSLSTDEGQRVHM
jgi:hypothetical protein